MFYVDNKYFRFMWVSISRHVQNKDDCCEPWLAKTTFHNPNFEDKGRTHVCHNKIKIEFFRGNSVQVCLSEVATDINRSKSCYNRLGLLICWIGVHCTVAQSPLSRIFQEVEYTSPTGWSNSHLSIEDKYALAVWQTAYFSGQLVQLLQMIIQSLI